MILHQNNRNLEKNTHLILTNQFMFPLEVDE